MINVENHITKEIMVWHKSDIIRIIKYFFLEDPLRFSAKSNYNNISNIVYVKHYSGSTYMIIIEIDESTEYTYVDDMISRMRELKLNKILK